VLSLINDHPWHSSLTSSNVEESREKRLSGGCYRNEEEAASKVEFVSVNPRSDKELLSTLT